MPAHVDAEAIRQVVAHQTTVAASVEALMRSVASVIGNALDEANLQPLQAMLKSIDDNPESWSDAILANTREAPLTAHFIDTPSYVAEPWVQHSNRVQEERAARAEGREPRHPAHAEQQQKPADKK